MIPKLREYLRDLTIKDIEDFQQRKVANYVFLSCAEKISNKNIVKRYFLLVGRLYNFLPPKP